MTDYQKWDAYEEECSDEDEPERKSLLREIRTKYLFASNDNSVLETMLYNRKSFLEENPPKESNRCDPLLDFVNIDDQNSLGYVTDECVGTKHFRFDSKDLYPQLEINPVLIDYTNRSLFKSNTFKAEHVIDISYFLNAYKGCAPKPDRNKLRMVANRPSNVVKAASWVDDLKKDDAQFNTLAGAYMAINMASVAETLREVHSNLGQKFLGLLVHQIKMSLKIELSFNEQTKDVIMYVNHDLECHLRELTLFATVPAFIIRTIPCCGKKQILQSIDESTMTKQLSNCNSSQLEVVEKIRTNCLNLFQTYSGFVKENVPERSITADMYRTTLEAAEYQGLLVEVKKVSDKAQKLKKKRGAC